MYDCPSRRIAPTRHFKLPAHTMLDVARIVPAMDIANIDLLEQEPVLRHHFGRVHFPLSTSCPWPAKIAGVSRVEHISRTSTSTVTQDKTQVDTLGCLHCCTAAPSREQGIPKGPKDFSNVPLHSPAGPNSKNSNLHVQSVGSLSFEVK